MRCPEHAEEDKEYREYSRSLGDVRCPERIVLAIDVSLDSRSLGDVRCPERRNTHRPATTILDHWEMCAVRNRLITREF